MTKHWSVYSNELKDISLAKISNIGLGDTGVHNLHSDL